MFNSLFNSLFGKSKENNFENSDEIKNNCNAESDQTEDPQNLFDSNVTAILLDEDRDWLFVEKESSSGEVNSTSSEQTPNNLQLVPFKNIFSHLGSISENDENNFLSANLPSLYPNSMDDSWFLTPPECFSSVSSIQLESSPLENLLIEHPSMSVYYNFRRGPSNALSRAEGIDDLVVIELSENDVEGGQVGKVQIKNRDKRNNKKQSRSNGGGAPKNVALVLVKKSNTQKPQDQRKPLQSKTAFERNNKCYALRNAPKRTTVINQPTSRMMMMINNKKN